MPISLGTMTLQVKIQKRREGYIPLHRNIEFLHLSNFTVILKLYGIIDKDIWAVMFMT